MSHSTQANAIERRSTHCLRRGAKSLAFHILGQVRAARTQSAAVVPDQPSTDDI